MKNAIFKIISIILFFFITSCGLSEKTLDKVSSSYITLNDSKIHYKEYGQAEKTLIFVHGWGCDLNTWKYQFDYFKDNYHLVLIDLPGYGQSDKVEKDYSIDLFAQSVLKIIRDLEIKNPVLVAHSMGLPVAIEVLQQLNSERAMLCNIDGVYFDFPTDSIENIQYKEGLTEFANMFKGDNYKQNVEQFCNSFITETTPEDVRNYILSTMTETPQKIGYQSMKSLIDQKYWDKEIVNNQTIAIYAKTTDLPPDNENILKQQFPDLTYIEMDSVNHFLMMEKPEEVNYILKEFIEK
ncbi:MAG TPA: alpha/beta hydrolase [Salegentibacter sp.]|uniref:alpha/beta fold hydrolase n=1 Tax=Salegentibacter sp. TaxID=1903072 RepID=UPI002F93F733